MNIKRLTRLDILILVLVVFIGLINLPTPFDGDQALSTIMASKMSHGEIIYRDLWDLKQPGIFCFYLLGGILFGFSEVGIHTFELLFMLSLSVVLILTLRGYFKHRWAVSIVPLFTVGIYYGVCGIWHQTQTEALVGFPIFLSLVFACQHSSSPSRQVLWLFLSGLMGALVLIFKFVFLGILTTFWITVVMDRVVRKQEKPGTAVLIVGIPVILGVLIPLLFMFGYFAWHGVLESVYWTFFEYPVRIMRDIPTRFDILLNGLRWFIEKFSPLMALGVVGAYGSLRGRRDLITLNLMLWSIFGFAVILLQRISWWQYHYLLLCVPLGILGVKGVDTLWPRMMGVGNSRSSRKHCFIGILSIMLLFSSPIFSLANKTLILARHSFALNGEDRMKYQVRRNKLYGDALQEVKFLSEPDSIPGDIYVFGSPVYYYLSNRDPAIPFLATWFAPTPELGTQVLKKLSATLPGYIFVDNRKVDGVRNKHPRLVLYIDRTMPFVEKNYSIMRRSDAGTWYVLRGSQPSSEQALEQAR